MTNLEGKILRILNRVSSEPPLLAAVVTVFIYSSPALLSIVKYGHIGLPNGFTQHIVVEPVFALIAIFINLFLLVVFVSAPAIKVNFNFILINDWARKLLIFFLLGIVSIINTHNRSKN